MKTYDVLVSVLQGNTYRVKAKSKKEAEKLVAAANGELVSENIHTFDIVSIEEV